MSLHAQLDSVTSVDNVNNVAPTVLVAQDHQLHAHLVSMDMLLIKLVELVNLPHLANSDNTTHNHPAHAPESAHKGPSSMKMSALLPASQDLMIMELEDVLLLFLKVDAHSLTILAMESVLATVPQVPILTQLNVFV